VGGGQKYINIFTLIMKSAHLTITCPYYFYGWGGSTLSVQALKERSDTSILTTVTPKMMTNNRDANPITIPAIAHCGKNTSSSAYPTVGTTCFANTVTNNHRNI
jgi:hypothetical protein